MARDIALAGGTGQTVQAEAARRLAAAIKPGDNLTVQIYHLAVRVDAQARAGVVNHRRRPGGMEGWRGDLVQWLWFAEVVIRARVHERIVARYGLFQIVRRHRYALILGV